MAKDLYEILGVSKGASADEIKKAYRTLAHQHHPDKASGDEAKFKEINAAYQVLSNADKRKQYDQFGQTFDQAGRQGQGGFSWEDFARSSQGGPFGGGFRQDNVQFDMGDLGDIFGDIFGMGRSSSRRRQRKARGSDIQTDMRVSFREAVFGVERLVELYKQVPCSNCSGSGAEPGASVDTCATCGGSGQVEQLQRTILGAFRSVGVCPECNGEGKKVSKKCKVCSGDGRVRKTEQMKVKIPAGINEGETIRITGKGETGVRGAGTGDLFITIRVEPDPDFKRDGDDIHSEAAISFAQAALGDKVPVKTLDGEVALKIPAGTQSAKVFRLKGEGVPHLRSRGRGDHLVTVTIVTPSHLTHEQRQLLERLRETE